MKPLLKIGLVLGQAAVVVAAFKAGQGAKADNRSPVRWEEYKTLVPAGAALNPVALNVENRNAATVMRGSYLVNGSQHCNFCHTCPPYSKDGKMLAPGVLPPINAVNYLAGGRRFGNPNDPNAPVSPNLTPDLKSGLPAGLTFNQFLNALRTGRSHRTGRDLKAMPWPMFNDLTDADLMSIYEYFRALPHAEPGPSYPAATGLGTPPPEN